MSSAFVQHALRYLEQASRCTHESLQRLTCNMRREQLDRLPMDAMFEPLRGPLHHVTTSRDIFVIPDDNVFFLDLLGECEVLSAEELRSRYFEALLCTPEDEVCHIVWLVLDVHSQACHALLHLTRRERGSAYDRDPAPGRGPPSPWSTPSTSPRTNCSVGRTHCTRSSCCPSRPSWTSAGARCA